MELTYRKVAEIWGKVNRRNSALMFDWIRCFSGNDDERKWKSKEEIRKTVTEKEYATDPTKNFLLRLMSEKHWIDGYKDKNGVSKRRDKLAMLFLQIMMEDAYWMDFIVTTLAAKHSKAKRESTNLNLPFSGSVECTCDYETKQLSLHEAARLEKVAHVRCLLQDETNIRSRKGPNQYGYTPLHFAAMAINPQAEIAELLINSLDRRNDCHKQFLNEKTGKEWGENTALHIAAANVNVTEEFIQQFKEADSRCLNSKKDTPFHVAARSPNPEAIIYMLNTFAPTNNRWDVDEVDEHKDPENTVINICAREGNVQAVALLIKHGANISQGVLHEIVLESVRDPEKIDDLVRVYQVIVANAVTWKCLEEAEMEKLGILKAKGFEILKVKGSDDYAELFRKTVIELLTTPVKKYDGKDVLQCALAHGASAMFWHIINTKSVFRIQGKDTEKFVDDEVENLQGNSYNWTVFDVTNFTKETCPKPSNSEKNTVLCCFSGSQSLGIPLQCIPGSNKGEKSHHTPKCFQRNDADGSKSTHAMPYLTYLLTVFDHWKGSNILSTQPLKALTKPYVELVQRFYLILGLLQLLFMILFTVYCMPTTCSLAQMFNVFTTGCSNSMHGNNSSVILASSNRQRSWITTFWLIWPIILFAGNVLNTFHVYKQANRSSEQQFQKTVLKAKDLRFPSFLGKLRTVLVRATPIRIFCISVFAWTGIYFNSESHELYAEVTAIVLLSGWITNLEFFGKIKKSFIIFELVLKEIIVKDIQSFMLYFGFTVIGFSFAMHMIRMSACMRNQVIHLDETVFAVLSSAFGIGDFFEATVMDPTCAGGAAQYLFEIVYLGYVCVTMIILLNVLIAMMNNRYEKAKRRAENIRRFQILSMLSLLESNNCLVKAMKKCRVLYLPSPHKSTEKSCFRVGWWYRDKHLTSLFYNRDLNRYYLRLLLPIDKRLEKR